MPAKATKSRNLGSKIYSKNKYKGNYIGKSRLFPTPFDWQGFAGAIAYRGKGRTLPLVQLQVNAVKLEHKKRGAKLED
jgi:hypothetical protein